MFTQYLSDEEFNKLDPEAVCAAHNSGDGDLYVTTGAELLEHDPSRTLTQAFDALLGDMRVDSFEILMVNRAGQIVQVAPAVPPQATAPPRDDLLNLLRRARDLIAYGDGSNQSKALLEDIRTALKS